MTEIRAAFDAHERVVQEPGGPSMAKQAFKDECDINQILRRFQKTGLVEHVRQTQGRYGDFVSAPEFQEACNLVIEARAMFDSLPSKVRKRFDNDPAAFLDFAQNPENEEGMRELGLLPPLESPQDAGDGGAAPGSAAPRETPHQASDGS